jgi:hypothetical protein
MFGKILEYLRFAAAALTCHHATYGALAGVYLAELAQLCDKVTALQIAIGVYLVMALRP